METYRVEWLPAAANAFRKLRRAVQESMAPRVTALESNPRPVGAKRLTGLGGLMRLRIGDYRVVYTIDDNQHVVVVSIVAHRREVYRRQVSDPLQGAFVPEEPEQRPTREP